MKQIIEYLSERRDYYKRQQEREESKINYNPSLRIEAIAKKEAFEEAIYHIKFVQRGE